ncbi:hypothetical protein ACVSQB_34720, partial [Bradyrhizobium elkanii]
MSQDPRDENPSKEAFQSRFQASPGTKLHSNIALSEDVSGKLRPSGGVIPWHKRVEFAARPT